MNTICNTNRSVFRFGSIFAIALMGAAIAQPARTQPILAEPGGTDTRIRVNGDRFEIDGGALSNNGANLFHSFEQFNLDRNQIADFLSNPDIQNILGRVVGNDPSVINGLIQVSGGNTNLYLMNPAGLIFGPGASLNVGGDFFATTATGIGFSNGWFNAFGDNNYATLTSRPTQLAFDLPQVGAIVNSGNLVVGEEQNITLVGGTIANAGTLQTTDGEITIAPVAGSSLIRISQFGNALSLEIELPRDDKGLVLPFTPLDLPRLLASTNEAETGLILTGENTVETGSGQTLPRLEGSPKSSPIFIPFLNRLIVVLENGVFVPPSAQPKPTPIAQPPTVEQPPIAQPPTVEQPPIPTPASPAPSPPPIAQSPKPTPPPESTPRRNRNSRAIEGSLKLETELSWTSNCISVNPDNRQLNLDQRCRIPRENILSVEPSQRPSRLPQPIPQSQQGDRLFRQGFEQYQAGQLEAAADSWNAALQLYQNQQNAEGEARTWGSLGNAYQASGRYADAIAANNEALSLWQTLQNRAEEGKVLGNLGNIYIELGDYDRAQELHQQSLEIARTLDDRQGEVRSLISLGAIAATQENNEEAKLAYQQAFAKAKEIGYLSAQATALNNLGSIHHTLGNYQNAIEAYQQVLELATSMESLRLESSALVNLGLAYLNLQDYPQALQYQEKSWEIARKMDNRPLESVALGNWGHTLWQAGDLPEAETKMRDAIALRESLRLDLDDSDKVSLFDTQARDYSNLQQILIARNQPEAALEIAERGRARAFVELLARRISGDAAADASNIQPPSLTKMREIARSRNATLVEYSVITDEQFVGQGKLQGAPVKLYIWVVAPNGKIHFRSVDLEATGISLQHLVRRSRRAINTKRGISQSLQHLHQLLIAPIAELLPAEEDARVVFVPHQSLFLIPFAALQDEAGSYLIEKHTILTAPSIQVLDLTRQQRQRIAQLPERDRPLVVGNPIMPEIRDRDGTPFQLSTLPGAEQEARDIATMLDTEPLLGDRATEATVKQHLTNARLVHLATHGLLDDFGTGIPGAIALAPSLQESQPQDGLLTSEELLGLQINAELVVLSACDTGRGDITGDGVIGLSRSLIAAGAPSVIVSLWAVPDAPTAELMTEFYRQLAQTSDKAIALRQAMLKTLEKHPKPLNWAAFTLIGESASNPSSG
ncbi:MAG: CHAT domain-containing protein [Cyanobacteriota bacterium]|nr:CHAT domain-containing protein [Cyanobacteriota bacterium]